MKPNVCHYEFFERGDVTRGFAEADQVIEETFEFPMIYQYAMEPHTSVARVTDGGITLWSSSAHPFLVRSELAHMFGLPHAKVEVIVPYVGGAYGSKSYFKIEPLIVAMARKTGGSTGAPCAKRAGGDADDAAPLRQGAHQDRL